MDLSAKKPSTLLLKRTSKCYIVHYLISVHNKLLFNSHGLVGHRTVDNAAQFKQPLVVAYFGVDYVKNTKGTNYWRNRILKVAQSFKDEFNFAISNKDDFQQELNEYGLEYISDDKPRVAVRDAKGTKYVMKDAFS